MLSLMKDSFYNYGLKTFPFKIDLVQFLKALKKFSKMSSSPGIESKTTNGPSYAMYDTLKELCLNNAGFFEKDDSENGQRLHSAFIGLVDHIDFITPLVDHIRKVASKYDFDEQTPGNGYRSFVVVADSAVIHGVKLCRHICSNRDSFLFRKGFYTREIEACNHFIASLGTCFEHLNTLIKWSEVGQLFPNEDKTPEELLAQSENINQYCFYGRCLGIQFCESMQNILKSISILMASFSETYYSTGGLMATANCVLTGGKYLIDPELRARRIVNISQYASVDFCKAFWFLAESELMKKLPSIVCATIAVNKEINISPEPLEVPTNSGGMVSIPVPSSHTEIGPIHVRLLSCRRREGMIGELNENSKKKDLAAPPSPGLIIHCHGGGFVAQSSQSHEVYLRDWASAMDVPILSIDYSLAPAAPFPRALEEVFYAYCWALKNHHLCGSTGERIILVGDSAGANLNLGITMKTIEFNIRKPSGVFLAYVPVLVSFVPSPARLLCLMDPLLPFGFMMRCLKAYACPDDSKKSTSEEERRLVTQENDDPNGDDSSHTLKHESVSGLSQSIVTPNSLFESETESFEEVSESDLMELVAHKSPVSETNSDTLTTVSLTSSQLSKPEADQFLRSPSDKDVNQLKKGFTLDLKGVDFNENNAEKYILDSEIKNGKKVAVLKTQPSEEKVLFEIPPPKQINNNLKGKYNNFKSLFSNTFSALSNPSGAVPSNNLDGSCAKSPSEEFRFEVPKNPYLSPYWADDSVLRQFPPTSICTVQFDPCLDDCVMFAKKLKRLGNCVKLDILDGLPHGFLNFTMVSKEAYEGSKLCVKRIKDLLDIESIAPQDGRLTIKKESLNSKHENELPSKLNDSQFEIN